MSPLLSVIVPVYKVEPYIYQCIDSILAQTFTDFELILVDDGSPDNCGKICDEYAEKDGRIIVTHKENGGLSSARNAGIEITKGELLTFIDSDDTIGHLTFQENIVYFLDDNNIDVLQYPIIWSNNISNNTIATSALINGTSEIFEYWWKGTPLSYSVCHKIFRRSVFTSIRFPKGAFFEDMAIVTQLINNCSRVKISEKGSYFYREVPNSISRSHFSFQTTKDIILARLSIYKESLKYPNLKYESRKYLLSIYWTWIISKMQEFTDKERQELVALCQLNKLTSRTFLFGYFHGQYTLKEFLRGFLISTLGIKVTWEIYNTLRSFNNFIKTR